ncbi:25S rRNA (adenine645-N1)-methyltransferase [Ascosphaera pollenicola]|nr:25S rRNA (adenine645-N1)-methyltransferase [Ascosphaera pollenicola]
MFAVPGWSLPQDSLKRQSTEKPTPAPPAQAPEGQNGSEAPASKAGNKKRKQGKGSDVKVTKANVDELFRKHIQGEADSKPEPKKKLDTKKRKLDEGSDETDKTKADGAQSTDAAQEAQGPMRKRNRKPKNKQQKSTEAPSTDDTPATSVDAPAPAPAPAPAAAPQKLTPLQQSMRNKLLAARFRYLNEQLYTTPSSEAYKLFTENPDFFNEYHAGFTRQVQELWPSNPVDWYIQSIKTRGAVRPQNRDSRRNKDKGGPEALPRRPNGSCTIADMGCGDAKLAHALVPLEKKIKLKFHNFDLQSPDPLVTKADIANLPLADGSCDVAVFCLSLMGTNWISFVEEAWRVLRSDGKGECWVSEVKSRFGKVSKRKTVPDHSISKRAQKKVAKKKKGKDDDEEINDDDIFVENRQETDQSDDTDISAFVEVFKSRGFVLKQETVDKSNKMFVRMEFVKHGAVTKGKHAGAAGSQAGRVQKKFIEKEKEDELTPEQEAQVLKPCLYKLR